MAVTPSAVSVTGAAAGVAATYHGASEGAAGLLPSALTARSLKRCSAPFVSPVKAWDVVPAPLPAMAVHGPQPGAGGARRVRYS